MKKEKPPSRAIGSRNVVKPRWDAKDRRLWYGDILVKRFDVPARSQEIILGAFEEEGWPPCVDDPLPFQKAVDRRIRLKCAIRHLNACQETPIIRFHGNGNGDGIRWEYEG